jgi:sirohydrochlorin cobaltochelatase
MAPPGLIIFAHGARDPRWAQPFEAVATRVRAARQDVEVRLAFLEVMRPTLEEVTDELVTVGCTAIRIAPIFFGQGGHVRDDLPKLLATLQARYPAVSLVLLAPAGESTLVQQAVATFCIDGI